MYAQIIGVHKSSLGAEDLGRLEFFHSRVRVSLVAGPSWGWASIQTKLLLGRECCHASASYPDWYLPVSRFLLLVLRVILY